MIKSLIFDFFKKLKNGKKTVNKNLYITHVKKILAKTLFQTTLCYLYLQFQFLKKNSLLVLLVYLEYNFQRAIITQDERYLR